jgi:hypothetical protein
MISKVCQYQGILLVSKTLMISISILLNDKLNGDLLMLVIWWMMLWSI